MIVSRKDGTAEIELSRLSPGDYFGEAGLFAGSGEPGTIRALTFAVVYEVGQAALAELMRDTVGSARGATTLMGLVPASVVTAQWVYFLWLRSC